MRRAVGPPARVAQLDRASVYGTEDAPSQAPQDQSDTPSDRAARSACAAPGPENAPQTTDSDPDLAKVTDAWPTLPEAVKAGIVAMVKAVRPEEGNVNE